MHCIVLSYYRFDAMNKQLDSSLAELNDVMRQLEKWERETDEVNSLIEELRHNVSSLSHLVTADELMMVDRLQASSSVLIL